jgi:MFS family permease
VSSLTPPTGRGPSPSLSDKILFWASFLTLIAAGIGFSVRGAILKDWGNQFGFTQSELGTITGGGLIGFGIAIIFFSFFADRFGYGKLMLVAFLLHTSSAVVTFAATPVYAQYGKEGAYWCLYVGMWLFALGNGTCEAVINPLTATLFPNNKTHWLNILHAGWPGGLILGAVITLGFNQSATPISWEIKLGVFLVPVLLYGLMMFNRLFPRSEAATAGVSMSDMMRQVGLLGFALVAGLLGLLLTNELPPLIKKSNLGIPDEVTKWIGWAAAGAILVLFWVASRFALGSIIIAFLYLLHALVGYVELGTDSWITNITTRVLADETTALLAFIWTNALMFTLRFFAGPIVHKINPVGLLFVSAVFGTVGLWLLGQPWTNTVWLWVAAVTVYGIGKTFYWPTLLGVISERFPKGGALALGISGGVGMMSAGLLGAPGIGYKQDYFAVQKLEQLQATDTYERYVARDEDGKPAPKPFPLLTLAFPDQFKPVAGIDNAKLQVFKDFKGIVAQVRAAAKANAPSETVPLVLSDREDTTREIEIKENGEAVRVPVQFVTRATYDARAAQAKAQGKEPPKLLQTTLQSDLETLRREKAAGKPVGEKLEADMTKLGEWWYTQGLPNFSTDEPKLSEADLYGSKQALLYTAVVPAALAVGFLLLILYFAAAGGYKQVHLAAPGPPSPPRGGAPREAWGR